MDTLNIVSVDIDSSEIGNYLPGVIEIEYQCETRL